MLQAGDPGWVPNRNSAALQAAGLGPAAAKSTSDSSSSSSSYDGGSSSDVGEFKEAVVSELMLGLNAAMMIPTSTMKSSTSGGDSNSDELTVALTEIKGELRSLAASYSRGDGGSGCGGKSGGGNDGGLRNELAELKEAVSDLKSGLSALTVAVASKK